MKTTPSKAPANLSLTKKLLYSLIVCGLFLGVLEIGLRLAKFNYTPRQRIFYKPTVGMYKGTLDFLIPTVFDPPGYIWLMPQSMVGRDANGDNIYEWPMEKKPGVKRVCFLGGSTTQPDIMRDYPRRTITLLNTALGAGKYESLNLGMSSYTTHQSLLALKRYGLPRHPDCVVVYHGWNDPAVMYDGYSDREHSYWLRSLRATEEPGTFWRQVAGCRITRLLAMAMNHADRSWPRLRVDCSEMREIYREMARLCAERGIPLVIVKRPVCHFGPCFEIADVQTLYYSKNHGLKDKRDIYYFVHPQITNMQDNVVHENPGIRLADACARLEEQQCALEQSPHEGVATFIEDAMHCTPLGYQAIAEVVALALAPEEAPKLKAFITSAEYWQKLALEFQQMDEPFLCTYAVEQAVQKDAALGSVLAPVQTWAQAQYVFWRLYLANIRSAGPRVPLDQRMANLDKCLEMRPSDTGVLASIFQAASWNGRTELAIPLLLKFKPANDQDRYGCLRMLFQAYAAARNWPETGKTAQALLAMNPADQDAQAFLAAVRNAALSPAKP